MKRNMTLILIALTVLAALVFCLLQAEIAKGAAVAKYGQNGPALLPDPHVTPGLVRPDTTTEQVCNGGSTKQYRNTTEKMKRHVYAEYGQVNHKGLCQYGCEIDHLISLELGGADDIKNLWPQPYAPRPGAHEKDELENKLHGLVCGGDMALSAAQQMIATDWYKAYVDLGLDAQ